MTEREELEAWRAWETQFVAAFRVWSNCTDHKAGCQAWTDVRRLLNSRPKPFDQSEAAA